MIDLTGKLLSKYHKKEGKIGRYSCSRIWAMLNGYTTPEQYLKGEEIDFRGAMNMWQGTFKHEVIQELLKDDYFLEYKKVKQVGDFEIVGMADCIIWDEILEIKTSDKVHLKAKPWAINQLKLYLSLFEIPKGRIVQPIKTANKLYLKVLGEYKRNDVWFSKTMDKLAIFHKRIMETEEINKEFDKAKQEDKLAEEGKEEHREKDGIEKANEEANEITEQEKLNKPF